jgi:arsenate reductase
MEVNVMEDKDKTRVLFVCVHNSARSQMAEALLNQIAGDRYIAQSAGLEPGTLNPLAVEVMHEIGIDISQNKTKDVFDFFKKGILFHYVVTVCDGAQAERCPIFPGVTQRVHCSFTDPSTLTGSRAEQLEKTREIRDQIKDWLEQWIK